MSIGLSRDEYETEHAEKDRRIAELEAKVAQLRENRDAWVDISAERMEKWKRLRQAIREARAEAQAHIDAGQSAFFKDALVSIERQLDGALEERGDEHG